MRELVISLIYLRSQLLLNNFYDYGPFQIIIGYCNPIIIDHTYIILFTVESLYV